MTARIIGVGQALRGDDAAGLLAAEAARALVSDGIEVMTESGDAAALLARLQDASAVVVIDSARAAAPPGTVLRLEAPFDLPRHAATSSHGNALADALALGGVLQTLPARLVVLAVVGEAFGLGAAMTPAVQAAVPLAAAQAVAWLRG
jgi:hydrogenase maturation protease